MNSSVFITCILLVSISINGCARTKYIAVDYDDRINLSDHNIKIGIDGKFTDFPITVLDYDALIFSVTDLEISYKTQIFVSQMLFALDKQRKAQCICARDYDDSTHVLRHCYVDSNMFDRTFLVLHHAENTGDFERILKLTPWTNGLLITHSAYAEGCRTISEHVPQVSGFKAIFGEGPNYIFDHPINDIR